MTTYTVHGELTADLRTIALVAGGPDVEVAEAARKLRSLTPLIQPSDPPGGLVLPASWAAVVQLANTFGAAWRPGPRLTGWINEQIALRAGPREPLRYEVPKGLKPYSWQTAGAQLIAALGRVLVTDEQGTGKTITTVLGLAERAFVAEVLPVVCVVPASTVDAWVEAWQTWAPHWRTVAWRGTPAQRARLAGTADVYVTSYDIARMDAPADGRKPLVKLGPTSVVIDETHMIKSPRAMRSLAVRRIARRAANVVALSGTPITHHPGDLWPTLTAIEPAAWPSRERWVERYCLSTSGDYDTDIVGLHPGFETEFRTALLGQHRRVAKADVLAELPPKVYSVRTVELPRVWRKVYDDMEDQMLAELPDGEELAVMSTRAKLTRLAQLASAAADVEVTIEVDEHGVERPHYKVTLKAPSWKVDALLEVLDERPGEPVVTFAPSRQLVMLAGQAAEKTGRRVGYIVGGQSSRERTDTIAAFQDGKLDLVCVTTGAGGTGITLTAARTVVFLQRPWSLVEAIQAEDRCHRIGSERHDFIEVIDIVARNTIDSRVRAVLRDKAGQLADLVQDPRIVAELLGGRNTTTTRRAA